MQIAGAFLRLHSEGDYGSPYEWSCGLQADPLDIRVAILGPVARPVRSDAVPYLAQALHEKGFTRARWVRVTEFNVADFLPKDKA